MNELKPGDKVFMNGKRPMLIRNKGVIFEVISPPWDLHGIQVVFLKNYPCCYASKGLTKVTESEENKGAHRVRT